MAPQSMHDVAVVGGGPAGLTAAMYATRLGHETALFNRDGGRYTAVSHVHNVIGVSEETSGREMTELALAQLEQYGADCYAEEVTAVARRDDGRFRVEGAETATVVDRVVLATGFTDNPPRVDGLLQFVGRGLHYCLHCDAYSLGGESVYVLGHDRSAAHVALVMLNFTGDVDLLLNGESPTWDAEQEDELAAEPVNVVPERVTGAFPDDPDADEQWLGGLSFADGATREYAGGFAMYGTEYNNELAAGLGCDLNDDGSVAVDAAGRTSVDGVYAAGDLTHGQNQTPIAVGDGARVGLELHEELRTYPRGADAAEESATPPAAPPAVVERMRALRDAEEFAGMSPE